LSTEERERIIDVGEAFRNARVKHFINRHRHSAPSDERAEAVDY
jgi:hypothetical protein